MSKEQKDLHKLVADFRKEFFEMKAEQLFPRSCNNLRKYRGMYINIFIKGTQYMLKVH